LKISDELKFRFVQLSQTENEISKDWNNSIPKNKVNITAKLSLEGTYFQLKFVLFPLQGKLMAC